MKRLIACIAAALFSATLVAAQEKKPDEPNSPEIRFSSKVFEIHNRDPRTIVTSLLLLGSGYERAGINVNDELRTITVRDFPENVAAVEDAIKRLDKPAADPDVELKIAVLVGSKTPLAGNPLPDDLVPVVKQLQATLRYANYSLLTANVLRTKGGRGVQGSGVIDEANATPEKNQHPTSYDYTLRNLAVVSKDGKPTLTMETFSFQLRYYAQGAGYNKARFETPLSIRDKQKVVIGTAAMGDKSLIVVLSADIQP